MREAELHVLYCLIRKPKLMRIANVDSKWFAGAGLQHLIELLHRLDGAFAGELDLISQFNGAYPNEMTRQDWLEIDNSAVTTADYSGWLKMVRDDYMNQQLRQAAFHYQQTPTRQNRAALESALDNTKQDDGIRSDVSLSDLADVMDYKLDHKVDDGLQTYTGLNDLMGGGLRGGILFTIGARPAVGKSAFALNLIHQLESKNKAVLVDLFSLEMTNNENYQRLLAMETTLDNSKFNNPSVQLAPNEKLTVKSAMERLKAQQLYLHDNIFFLDEIIAKISAHAQAAAKGKYLAVIDYLQLIKTKQPNENRTLEISSITRELKLLTNELDIPIILLSQLNRQVEMRPNKVPNSADLRDSGSIEQDSNIVAFLYNGYLECGQPKSYRPKPNEPRKVILDIQKNRAGALGRVSFSFAANQLKFKEVFL
ncbi:DnaB-like helicase C-terminal domain-containing protein [Lactobacillus selangorensis]|uniref:DnaB-like helicase C-terminal domain-containing protein n=1 Tax=Lactobacillus selangorensis TaxID=81857 RepID=UPI00070EE915|nr:DnaB-like helicase C-terminal domain-containing protein [Lactobacillus selangorensis]